MKQRTIIYLTITIILALSNKVLASTFHCDGKEVSKGTVIKLLATKSAKVCTKTDEVEFNDEKGTLKNKKASK